MSDPAQVERVRRWMIRNPRPASVRVTSVSGEVSDVHIEGTRPRWANYAETICQLNPVKLTALGEDESVIRIEEIDGASVTKGTGDGAQVARITHPDPVAAQQMLTAQLIADAYKHATDVAFSKLVELTDRILTRMDQMEERIQRTESAYHAELRARMKMEFEGREEDTGLFGEIAKEWAGAYRNGKEENAQEGSNGQSESPSNGKAPSYSSVWGG